MFDTAIANAAAAFIEVDGVWYAPASELMELFAAYSSMVAGFMVVLLVGWGAFILLIYEPVGELIRWVARKAAAFFSSNHPQCG